MDFLLALVLIIVFWGFVCGIVLYKETEKLNKLKREAEQEARIAEVIINKLCKATEGCLKKTSNSRNGNIQ